MTLVAKHKQDLFNTNFIGRLKYIGNFNETFNNPKKFNVLMYYGLGGIGKSTLLKQLNKNTKKRQNAIPIFINLELHDTPEKFYQNIKLTLRKYKIRTTYFDLAFLAYWQKKNPHLELTKENYAFLEEGSVLADSLSLMEGIASFTPIISGIINIANKHKNKIRMLLSNGNNIKNELEELDDLEADEIEELFQKFLDYDIREFINKTEEKRLIFFLDTYESLYKNSNYTRHTKADEWIRELIITLEDTRTLFVVAGRDELKWVIENKAWSEYLEQYELLGLSDSESDQLLIKSGIEDEQIRQEIIKNSNNVPFYLEQSVKLFRSIKEPSVADFKDIDSTTTFERLLQYSDQHETHLLKHLAVARFFTKDLHKSITKHFNLITIPIERISKKLSIDIEINVYKMHNLLQSSLIKNTEKEILEEVHQFLIEYYANLFDNELQNPSELLITAFREELYHRSKIHSTDFLTWFSTKLELIKMIGYTNQIPKIISDAITLNMTFESDLLLELSLFYTEIKQYENAKNILFYELGEANISEKQQALFYYIAGTLNLEESKPYFNLLSKGIKLCHSPDLLVRLNYALERYSEVAQIIFEENVSDLIASDYYCKIANKNPSLGLNERIKILDAAFKRLSEYKYAFIKKANVNFEKAQAYYFHKQYDESITFINTSLGYYNQANDINKELLFDTYDLLAKTLKEKNSLYNIKTFPKNCDINMAFQANIKHLLTNQKETEKYVKFVTENIQEKDFERMQYAIGKFYFEKKKYLDAKTLFINLKQKELIDHRLKAKTLTKLIIISNDRSELTSYLIELQELLQDTKLISKNYKKIYFYFMKQNKQKALEFLEKDIHLIESCYKENPVKHYKELLSTYNNAITYYKTFPTKNVDKTYSYIDLYIKIAKENHDQTKTAIGYSLLITFSSDIKNYDLLNDRENEIVSTLNSNKFNPIIDKLYISLNERYEKSHDVEHLEKYLLKQLQERKKEGTEAYKLSRTYYFIATFYKNKKNNVNLYEKYLLLAIEKNDHLNYAETFRQYIQLLTFYLDNDQAKIDNLILHFITYVQQYELKENATQSYIYFITNTIWLLRKTRSSKSMYLVNDLQDINENLLNKKLTKTQLLTYYKTLTMHKSFLDDDNVLTYYAKQDDIMNTLLSEDKKFFLKNHKAVIRFYFSFASFLFDQRVEPALSEKYILKIRDLIKAYLSHEDIRSYCTYVNAYYMRKLNDFNKTLSEGLLDLEINLQKKSSNVKKLSFLYKYLQDNYLQTKDYSRSIEYLNKLNRLYNYSTERSFVELSIFYYNKIYKELDNLDEKTIHLSKIIDINTKLTALKSSNKYFLASLHKEMYELNLEIKNYRASIKHFIKSIRIYNNPLNEDLYSLMKFYKNICTRLDINDHEKIKYLIRTIKIQEHLKLVSYQQSFDSYKEILFISIDINDKVTYEYLKKSIHIFRNLNNDPKNIKEYYYQLDKVVNKLNVFHELKTFLHNELMYWKNIEGNNIRFIYDLLYEIYLYEHNHQRLIRYIKNTNSSPAEEFLYIIKNHSETCGENRSKYYASYVELKEPDIENDLKRIEFYKEVITNFNTTFYDQTYKSIYIKKLFDINNQLDHIIEIFNNTNMLIYNDVETFLNSDGNNDIGAYHDFMHRIKMKLKKSFIDITN